MDDTAVATSADGYTAEIEQQEVLGEHTTEE